LLCIVVNVPFAHPLCSCSIILPIWFGHLPRTGDQWPPSAVSPAGPALKQHGNRRFLAPTDHAQLHRQRQFAFPSSGYASCSTICKVGAKAAMISHKLLGPCVKQTPSKATLL
jgi:hypothetical protein